MSEAELHEVSGMMAVVRLDVEPAIEHFRSAISLFESAGATHPAARVSSRLGDAEWTHGKGADALETMEASYEVLADEEPDADLAELAAQLARFSYFAGDTDAALERVERALEIAEALDLPDVLSEALNTKALIFLTLGRSNEAAGLLGHALSIALEHDKPSAALRALNNLVDLSNSADRYAEADRLVDEGLSLARRVGNRFWESSLLGHVYPKFASGKWDELLESLDEIPEDEFERARAGLRAGIRRVRDGRRGPPRRAGRGRPPAQPFSELEDVGRRPGGGRVRVRRRDAPPRRGRRQGGAPVRGGRDRRQGAMSVGHMSVKEAVVVGLEAASSLDDRDTLAELLEMIRSDPLGRRLLYFQAHVARFEARSPTRGEDEVERLLKASIGAFREIGFPFWMAVALLEYGEWLDARGRAPDAAPIVLEARSIFEELEARPWVERCERVPEATTVQAWKAATDPAPRPQYDAPHDHGHHAARRHRTALGSVRTAGRELVSRLRPTGAQARLGPVRRHRGPTARADGADPEDVRDRNQLYFQDARERIERHGGIVEKYVGDAVMAVFGARPSRGRTTRSGRSAPGSDPRGHRGAERRERGPRPRRCAPPSRPGRPSSRSDAAPGDALATGDVVNTAARLQPPRRRAAWSWARRPIASPATRSSSIGSRRSTRRARRSPVSAWSVVEALAAPGAPADVGHAARGPRARAGAARHGLGARLEDRRPHLVTIVGAAGVGKSRIARETSARVEASGGRAFWGRSLPYEEQTPYRAAGRDHPARRRRLRERSAGGGPRQGRGLVADLFAPEESADATRFLELSSSGSAWTTPRTRRSTSCSRCGCSWSTFAAREPLLLVFEDVHWANDAMVDPIDYVVAHVREARVVILVLARPEFLETRRTWGGGMVGQTTLPLEASRSGTRRRSCRPCCRRRRRPRSSASSPSPRATRCSSRSWSRRWGTRSRATSCRRRWAAIAARIDAAGRRPRRAPERLGIGQTFWRGVLEAIGDLDAVDEALDALEARGSILRRPHSEIHGDVEFGFKHALILDVAYGTLPRTTRRNLHAAIAQYVEALADPADLAWLLAHHWREAGDLDAARGYLLAAAERARAVLAVEQTYDLYTRALEPATTDEERRRIRLRRGVALSELEDYARADRELAELIPELSGVDEVEALLARGRATTWTEKTTATFEVAERAWSSSAGRAAGARGGRAGTPLPGARDAGGRRRPREGAGARGPRPGDLAAR